MEYTAQISWKRTTPDFQVKTYDRTHQIKFGGGSQIDGSSAKEFAGKAELPNPEELFTAAISSCFMLTFLYWTATKGFQLQSYTCQSVGKLAKNAEGKMAITEVTLKPQLKFSGDTPDSATLNDLYKKAHDNCFISSSVKTKVTIAEEEVA